MKWPLVVLLGIGLFFSWPQVFSALPKAPSDPPLISSLKIDTPLDLCDEPVPLEIQEVRERLEKELLLTLWDRPQVILWLKRSRRYLPYIEEMLQKNGIPGDLKYIALAESALRPHAGSPKGAMGFWQFMQDTGRQYGLAINSRIDERRNIFASTQAAVKYFKDLYKQFGSWTLAAAAYNMGGDALADEIQEQGIKDYYRLYLPIETQRYVFRILSIKLIFSDPKRYGFHLSGEDYYPPLEFDRIQVNCLQDTHLRIIAQAAKTHFKEIKDLNPEIRGYSLPAGKHSILIPKGAARGFEARYQPLPHQQLADQKEHIYVVKEADTLSSIANRFGVPLSSIITWNHLNRKITIRPGDKLIIYRKVQEPVENDEGEGKGASPVND
ncbi:MAG: lytic transglycosylase [Deltaproteobacteria bacterium RBG_16_54_11]|nr:MAG: lytic transglycosylase [Deltaproteobacteria bacterium RBG_16_54_11]